MFFYRVLSFFVNIFCAVAAIFTLFGILYAISYPPALFQCFLLVGTVLYGWFANRFHIQVIIKQQSFSKKQKDWLQVNAIVALIFCMLGISNAAYIYKNPGVFDDLIKQLPKEMGVSKQMLLNITEGLFVCCLILLVHVVWTYILLRKNQAVIEE